MKRLFSNMLVVLLLSPLAVAQAPGHSPSRDLEVTDETIFIAAALDQKGINFLKGDRPIGVRKNEPEKAAPTAIATTNDYEVTVNGRRYRVSLDGDRAVVDGKDYGFKVEEATGGSAPAAAASGTPVTAELPGKVWKVVVAVGDQVAEGDTLIVLEALKMEIPVAAPKAGKVTEVSVAVAEMVAAGDVLVRLA
jgi:pyruvate carboxylase subunit B